MSATANGPSVMVVEDDYDIREAISVVCLSPARHAAAVTPA
ncbi:MAG: hypothetical protein QM723_19085 [Myxococcaceae bacterium]